LQLSAQIDLADHGLESVVFQILGDRLSIDRTGAFKRLGENLAVCVFAPTTPI